MQSIEYDQRIRHDPDSRRDYFDPSSPLYTPPGTVLLIEQLTSRTRPQPQIFAGVLLEIRHRGIMTTIVLRNYVLKTAVELIVPVFSPMVSKIVVLKRLGAEQVEMLRKNSNPMPPKRETRASKYVWRETKSLYWIREKPLESPVPFAVIEDMIRKYRQREGTYTERLHLYNQKIWTCEQSGKTGLTYEEALQSEEKFRKEFEDGLFPECWKAAALKIIHYNTLPLGELSHYLYDHFSKQFYVGESVTVDTQPPLPGKITELLNSNTNVTVTHTMGRSERSGGSNYSNGGGNGSGGFIRVKVLGEEGEKEIVVAR
ncbi:hypothetical protein HK098_008121, partial [Nowakowskiella sp. JEL0407]